MARTRSVTHACYDACHVCTITYVAGHSYACRDAHVLRQHWCDQTPPPGLPVGMTIPNPIPPELHLKQQQHVMLYVAQKNSKARKMGQREARLPVQLNSECTHDMHGNVAWPDMACMLMRCACWHTIAQVWKIPNSSRW